MKLILSSAGQLTSLYTLNSEVDLYVSKTSLFFHMNFYTYYLSREAGWLQVGKGNEKLPVQQTATVTSEAHYLALFHLIPLLCYISLLLMHEAVEQAPTNHEKLTGCGDTVVSGYFSVMYLAAV